MARFDSFCVTALAIAMVMLILWPVAGQSAEEQAFHYPSTRTSVVADEYHGTLVRNPYRWLEELNSAETKDWVNAQNGVTFKYLDSLPLRAAFHKRITELWDYPKISTPWWAGGRLWYRRNSGLQPQSVVYAREKIDSAPVAVLDPNALSPNGSISLDQITPSPDGKLMAYALSEEGEDWRHIRVRDIASGADLADSIRWVRYSRIEWTHDAKGFFYSRYPAPLPGQELEAPIGIHSLYYHRIGRPQSDDQLISEQKTRPDWFVQGDVSDDGRYLVIRISQRSARSNRLLFVDLENPKKPKLDGEAMAMFGTGNAFYRVLGNVGTVFYLLTNDAAPNQRIVAIDIRQPEPRTVRTVLNQGRHVIQNAILSGGKIVVQYLVDVQSQIKLFALDGSELGKLGLPAVGTIRDLSGLYDSEELFYRFTSPLHPSMVYMCRGLCRSSIPFDSIKSPFDAHAYETRQLFAKSKDGTRIPYFLTSRKNIKRDGNNPLLLYAYGGFSTSLTPSYRPAVPAWLERGGIFVTANVRGGGTYGEGWHRDGILQKKQNSFEDFIAVAEDLIKRAYTSPAKLAVRGKLERWAACRRGHQSKAGPLRRCAARRGRDGHVAL